VFPWEAWPEIWDILGPMTERAITTGEASWSEDILMVIDRELPREPWSEPVRHAVVLPIRSGTAEHLAGVLVAGVSPRRPLPLAMFVDRDMWEKILLNLLSNALKHTFEGGIVVSLEPGPRLPSGVPCARLCVQDTGVGIAQGELPHVFERFHRARGVRSRTHEGAGIGLALVKELVKLHGGDIGVESEEGQGTRFTVRIPAGGRFRPHWRGGVRERSPGRRGDPSPGHVHLQEGHDAAEPAPAPAAHGS
jgi:signal transduction histidine kinase